MTQEELDNIKSWTTSGWMWWYLILLTFSSFVLKLCYDARWVFMVLDAVMFVVGVLSLMLHYVAKGMIRQLEKRNSPD